MFDLNAAVGNQVAEPFRFRWGAHDFELPAVASLPVDIQIRLIDSIERIEALNPNEVVDLLRLLIDDAMMATLSAAKPLTVQALMALITAWVSGQGADLGKSAPSPASSAPTAKPSRATSRSGRARKTS